MTIKEQMAAVAKLESQEGIRHVLAAKALREQCREIQARCPHTVVKTIQCSPENIDVCDECGNLIL